MAEKNYILTQEEASYKLQRLALEIAEQLQGDDAELFIIGVKTNGLVIAEKIAVFLKPYLSIPFQVISAGLNKDLPVDITLSKEINFDNKNIIIVDDVANSGKTLLYMLKPLLSFHPKRIQTLVLVERMHKLYPVKPDYVGLSISTTLQDHIQVEVKDGEVLGAFVN
ncbi:bifunctional protein PyrR [mine drainage metagenome]|uniref:Bifunctional protein PyrR n=1 Tax=mine drainage metagenome TaxID=410659 RepID=A0A1J5SW65_9ZZZZ